MRYFPLKAPLGKVTNECRYHFTKEEQDLAPGLQVRGRRVAILIPPPLKSVQVLPLISVGARSLSAARDHPLEAEKKGPKVV